jgi:hypothetical protein
MSCALTPWKWRYRPLGSLRWYRAGSAGTRPAAERRGRPAQTGPGCAARCPVGSLRTAAADGQGQALAVAARMAKRMVDNFMVSLPSRTPAATARGVKDGPVHSAYRGRPSSARAQTSRCCEAPAVPCLRREGLAAGPGRKWPCNGWTWASVSPDMRWVLRCPPARCLRSRRIRVHHLAASGPPHARAAVRSRECMHARSAALDLGSAP